MTIKEVTLNNYQSYYGTKSFTLDEGLNIILGLNQRGKTKFFEALDWLFKSQKTDLKSLVSKKALAETEVNGKFQVSVSITVSKDRREKVISKSFVVTKTGDKEFTTSTLDFWGIEENEDGERIKVDGQTTLEGVFPSSIRRYSMFKGESELNLFDNDTALIGLINLFSDARYYEKYQRVGKVLKQSAESEIDVQTRNNVRDRAKLDRITAELDSLIRRKDKVLEQLNAAREEVSKTESAIREVEVHIENAEALDTINKRINDIEEKIRKKETLIAEREKYTANLFNKKWILANFEPLHVAFSEKIAALSSKRREMQSEFDRELGKREGEKNALAALASQIPLPVGTPTRAHMEEMIEAEWCKVCNRAAPKGSEAYEYMVHRLHQYFESQQPTSKVEEQQANEKLYKHNYTARLENMSHSHDNYLKNIREINKEIEENFEFVLARKAELIGLRQTESRELEDRARITNNSRIGANKLGDVLINYNGFQRYLSDQNFLVIKHSQELADIEKDTAEKAKEKENINVSNAAQFLLRKRDIVRDLEKIFKDVKTEKFDAFIELLKAKSNEIFKKINEGSFTGSIHFAKQVNEQGAVKVILSLRQDNDAFENPSESLKTSMHISILLAISKLTFEKHEENYPIVLDAPTSSFDDTKKEQFFKVLKGVGGQIIVCSKDFQKEDPGSREEYILDEFQNIDRDKAFMLKLKKPFDEQKLATIETLIYNL